MKRLVAFVAFVLLGCSVFTSIPVGVQAQSFCDDPKAQATDFCKNQSTNGNPTNNTIVGPNGIMTRLVTVLSIIVGAASVIMVIIGGIMFVVSNGDSGQVSKARQTVIYALVGLVIAIFARAIVAFVLNRL